MGKGSDERMGVPTPGNLFIHNRTQHFCKYTDRVHAMERKLGHDGMATGA